MMHLLSLLSQRDIYEDKRSGITTLAILIGYRRSRYLYFFMVMVDAFESTIIFSPSIKIAKRELMVLAFRTTTHLLLFYLWAG